MTVDSQCAVYFSVACQYKIFATGTYCMFCRWL